MVILMKFWLLFFFFIFSLFFSFFLCFFCCFFLIVVETFYHKAFIFEFFALKSSNFNDSLLKKVRKKDDGQIFAMKALKKRTLIMKKQLRYAISEANVLKMSNHPFVLGLHYAFQVFFFGFFPVEKSPFFRQKKTCSLWWIIAQEAIFRTI